MLPVARVSAIVFFVNPPLAYWLVFRSGLPGITAAALAFSSASILQFLLLVLECSSLPFCADFHFVSSSSSSAEPNADLSAGRASAFELQGLIEFLKLGLPGLTMTCAEWWCFEITTLLSGVIGK